MAFALVASLVGGLRDVPERSRRVVTAYLLALMINAPKHTQAFAASVAGLNKSQFCRLLSTHGEMPVSCLETLAAQAGKLAAIKREPLVRGAKWTVALIIDATLHPRSSLHVHNAQRFNHGQGFVIGHQWTNIVIYLNGRLIPLPPIAFLSKKECRRLEKTYKTEHERVAEYLANLRLADFIGLHAPDEVVVIADSGYDDKLLERLVLSLGWGLLFSLKSSRGTQTKTEATSTPKAWRRIDALFRAVRKPAPWATVRLETDGGKKRTTFRARKLIGRIKGVHCDVTLICSEKSNGKGRRYFACTNTTAAVGVLIRAYRIRWQIELFHRVVKNQLGLLDAGVCDFTSLSAHVHWVYCAWLLLHRIECPGAASLLEKQRALQAAAARSPMVAKIKHIVAARTQFGGLSRQKRLVQAAFQEACAM